MAKSSFERAIERQRKEAIKLAQQEAKRQRASAIINGQPMIGGMRIMDAAAEEILKIILEKYDGNDNRSVCGNSDDIPKAYRYSMSLELEKLNMYGMISSQAMYIDGTWKVSLTPQSYTYFEDKEKMLKSNSTEQKLKQNRKEYDVFISHANKDKSDYVDALYLTMRKLGIRIFYDTEILSWGDNWKQVIIDGTNASEFAIIVVSDNFLIENGQRENCMNFYNDKIRVDKK